MKYMQSARFARRSLVLALVSFMLFIQCVLILVSIPALVPVAFPGLFISAGLVFLGILGMLPRFCKKDALTRAFLRRCAEEQRTRTAERVQRMADRKAHREAIEKAVIGHYYAEQRMKWILDTIRWRREERARYAQQTLPL
jgi:hypothetical protein